MNERDRRLRVPGDTRRQGRFRESGLPKLVVDLGHDDQSSHHETNIGMTLRSCEMGCPTFRLTLAF